MNFLEGLYHIHFEINISERNVFENFRRKIPRHENENTDFFIARLLSYCHGYEEGLTFSKDPFLDEEPTIQLEDAIGDPLVRLYVGKPCARLLRVSIKQFPNCRHQIYFFSEQQISAFCHHLRGSTHNWIQEVKFFLLDGPKIGEIVPSIVHEMNWAATILEGGDTYLDINGVEFYLQMEELNMWSRFQQSIENVSLL